MLFPVVVLILISGLNGELFSATEEMKQLIDEHGELVLDLTVLVKTLEDELTYLKR
jgi:hypothetical protein